MGEWCRIPKFSLEYLIKMDIALLINDLNSPQNVTIQLENGVFEENRSKKSIHLINLA